jgi:hypothetical protein
VQPWARLYLPLLLVKVSRELLSPQYSHKDECKLAAEMGAALFEQMNQCGNLGEEAVRKLRMYGMLIGPCDFEAVVVYLDAWIEAAAFNCSSAGTEKDNIVPAKEKARCVFSRPEPAAFDVTLKQERDG